MTDEKELTVTNAYITGTHPYSFRQGEFAKIIGIKFVNQEGQNSRLCYHVEYDDGVKDWIPVDDDSNPYVFKEGLESL